MIEPPDNVTEFLVYRASYSSEYEVFVFSGVSVTDVLESLRQGKPIPEDVVSNTKTYVFDASQREEYMSRNLLQAWFNKLGLANKLADSCSSWRLYAVINGHGFPPNFQGHPLVRSIDRTPHVIKRQSIPRDMFDPLAGIMEGFAFYD